jgi:hypothetical protein
MIVHQTIITITLQTTGHWQGVIASTMNPGEITLVKDNIAAMLRAMTGNLEHQPETNDN